MKHWRITYWCEDATRKIRYGPDREAVREELRQHLDDRSDSFLAQGMKEEEAVKKALEVMGDPDELSVILAQIHRPFWGFAYSISKILAIVMAIVALVFIVWKTADKLWDPQYSQPYYSDYLPSYADTENKHFTRVGLWDPSDSISFGGYTYQLEKCARWDNKAEGKDLLRVQIRITNYLPWADWPYAEKLLEAEDNLGNYYVNTWFKDSDQPHSLYGAFANYTEPFVWLMDVTVYSPDFSGVEWIELRSMECQDLVLRIDLPGGDAQ